MKPKKNFICGVLIFILMEKMHLPRLELSRPLLFFDLETTGTDTAIDRILQLGYLLIRPDFTTTSWHSLIDPLVPIPVGASEKHGITEEIIKTGCAKCRRLAAEHRDEDDCHEWHAVPEFKDLAPRLLAGFQRCDYAGYNVMGFDLPLLEEEFGRCGLEFDWGRRNVVDGMAIWRLLEGRTLSDAVRKFVGRELEGAHDAMVDVVGSAEAVAGMLRSAPSYGREPLPTTPEAIHIACFGERDPDWIDAFGKFKFVNGVACFNFGKNLGRPMSADTKYLKWMASASFSMEVRRLASEGAMGRFPKREGPSGGPSAVPLSGTLF